MIWPKEVTLVGRTIVPLAMFSYQITIRSTHGKSVIEMEIQPQDIFPYHLFLIHQAWKFKKIHFNVKPIFSILPLGRLRANSLGSQKIAEQSEQLHPSWCSTKFHRNSHPKYCTNTFEDWDKYISLNFAAFPFSWNFITFPQIGPLPCVSNLFNLLLSACKNTTNCLGTQMTFHDSILSSIFPLGSSQKNVFLGISP